jgi:alcohol dehydrogenase (cytochrome c)
MRQLCRATDSGKLPRSLPSRANILKNDCNPESGVTHLKPFPYTAAAFAFAALSTVATQGAHAQTTQEITASSNPDNVLTYGMSYNQHRYSTLTQINKRNVKQLVPVWSQSLENEFGEQGQPLVYNGVMYVANSKFTVAYEAATGKVLWRTPVNYDPATPRVVC